MKRFTFFFERNSLFWKIYTAIIFALIVPFILFSTHRFFDERKRARAYDENLPELIHNWSTALSEQADELPDEELPEWIAEKERESGMLFYVVRGGAAFHAMGSEAYRANLTSGEPSVEDLSSSGRTRVVVALRPPKTPPQGARSVRNAGFFIVAVAGVILSFRIVRSFKAPLDELRRASIRFAEGDFSVRAGRELTEGGAEIGDLAASFNWMAERVEELANSRERLFSDISHEIRSPLHRMDFAIELARRSSPDDAEKYFDRVEKDIERIDEMLKELLTLTRPESQAARRGPVDIEEILCIVADDAEFVGQEQGKTVEIESEPLVVHGDANLLQRAIGNVVYNAVRHTPAGAKVRISARREGAFALIEVADSGLGVSEEELEKIFTPYYRTDLAREHTQGGTGLGLSITKRLVESHGGSVSASNVPSGGLRVSIRLPLSSE